MDKFIIENPEAELKDIKMVKTLTKEVTETIEYPTIEQIDEQIASHEASIVSVTQAEQAEIDRLKAMKADITAEVEKVK